MVLETCQIWRPTWMSVICRCLSFQSPPSASSLCQNISAGGLRDILECAFVFGKPFDLCNLEMLCSIILPFWTISISSYIRLGLEKDQVKQMGRGLEKTCVELVTRALLWGTSKALNTSWSYLFHLGLSGCGHQQATLSHMVLFLTYVGKKIRAREFEHLSCHTFK